MSEETIAYLKQVTPFRDLSEDSFRAIADDVTHVEIPEGQVIIREGDEGDSLYIIKSGSVQVFINGPEQGEKIILTKLSEADYFGEMSLITGEPRSASIETLTNVSLLRLDKEGFKRLITDNPKVSLSLSHMLSQRLKQANIKRVETEKFYHSRITQSGSLSEIPFYELLKFCEQNALTGRVKIEHADDIAEISFLKGNVQAVELRDLPEDQAMDTLMQWQEGNFVIEPSFFTHEEPLTAAAHTHADESGGQHLPVREAEPEPESEPVREPDQTPSSTREIIERLLNDTFRQLISVVGSQHLRECVIAAQEQLVPFFDTLESLKFSFAPEFRAELSPEGEWNDRRTLAAAVFLQSIIQRCTVLAIGMRYFDVREIAGRHAPELEKLSFFEYMSHADELAGAR